MATSVDSLSIQITASTKQAKDKVDALCTSLNALVVAINALDVSKFETLSAAVNGLSQGLSSIKTSGVRSVEKMAEAIDSVQSKSQAFDPIAQGAEKVVTATEEATKSTEQVAEVVDALHADPLDELANAAERASSSMEKSASKMSAFKSMLAGLKIIVPTDGLVDVNKKIDKLQAKIADLKDKLAYNSRTNPDFVDSEEMEKDQKQIQGLINELERLKLKKQELESHGGFKFGWNTSFSEIGRSIKAANKALSGFVSKLHISKSATRDTAKANNEFKLSADRLVKSLTKVTRMLKLMVTRMALRAVIKEVGNGFKSLALHSEEFNSSMSSLINSSKKLGYSFAGMVGPLINALAPALIRLIELITKAINVINQLFSALSGKGTYNKAKDFSENWADNIQAANKQAKELKKTVLGFDELNQLTDKTTSGGDTSGNIEDMFETVAIESKWADLANYIKNLAKKLFDPIKKAWQKVGDFVKKSWKYAMDEVLKLVKSVARDFWKVWEQEETQKIFENILKIVGYIGLAVGNLAKRFREAWDQNDTGLHILENIRDVILIITEHLVNMAKATAEWADSLDFSPILTKFNEWLESIKPVIDSLMGIVEDFYTTVILPLAEWAIEKGGPQLLQVFIDFNEKVKWEELRDKLKTLWEHVEPFAEKVGEGLIIFIDRVAQALANFINSQDFEDFLKAIEDWMDKVTPQDVADGFEAIAKALIGFAAVKTVLSVLTAVASFCSTIAALGGLLKLAIVITVAVVGLKIGGKIGEWLTGDKATYENFKWWGDGGFFETVFGGVGGIDDAIKRIGELKTAWYDMANEADAGIRAIAQSLNMIVNPIGDIFDKVTRLAGYKFNWETLSFEKIRDEAKESAEAMDTFKAKLLVTKGAFADASKESKNMGEQFVDTHKKSESFSEALGRLKDKAETTHTSLGNTVKTLEKDVNTSFGSIYNTYHTSTENIELETYGLNTTMSGQWQEISQTVDNSSEDIVNSTSKVKDAFDEKNWTFDGVMDGLKKTFKNAIDAVKKLWNKFVNDADNEGEIGGSKFKFKLPKFFASGGFPEDGWFRASHGEMIGTFDNGQSVVANNTQIVEGISAGVYNAVSAAMARNNSGNSGYIANTIVVDGEVIARTVTKAQERQNMRYSPNMG